MPRFPLIIYLLLPLALSPAYAQQQADRETVHAVPSPGVGQGAAFTLTLPWPDVEPRAAAKDAPLHLVLDRREATDQEWRYHLRAIAFEPGLHPLQPWLRHHDGRALSGDLPLLRVPSLLGAVEHWDLQAPAAGDSPRGLRYGDILNAAILLWVLATLSWLGWRRWRQSAMRPAPSAARDPLPELIAAAQAKTLDAGELARLEGMLIQRWRRALPTNAEGDSGPDGLNDDNLATAIAHLRQDPQLGQLLQRVEQYLHAPRSLLATEQALPSAAELLRPNPPPQSRGEQP